MMNLKSLLVAELRRNLQHRDAPRIPAGGQIVWACFNELSRARGFHAAGPNPISYCEIEAYCRLTRWPLAPHHIAMIRALDECYIDHCLASAKGAPAGVKTLQPRSSSPMTGGLFDAMFG